MYEKEIMITILRAYMQDQQLYWLKKQKNMNRSLNL